MIALDTSALIALVANEPEAEVFAQIISENDCVIGAPTQLEAMLIAERDPTGGAARDLRSIFAWRNVGIVDFSAAHGEAAHRAFQDFGKGRGHRAELNYGDCMAYAVAKLSSAPLLFKGEDFSATDIVAAWRP